MRKLSIINGWKRKENGREKTREETEIGTVTGGLHGMTIEIETGIAVVVIGTETDMRKRIYMLYRESITL